MNKTLTAEEQFLIELLNEEREMKALTKKRRAIEVSRKWEERQNGNFVFKNGDVIATIIPSKRGFYVRHAVYSSGELPTIEEAKSMAAYLIVPGPPTPPARMPNKPSKRADKWKNNPFGNSDLFTRNRGEADHG